MPVPDFSPGEVLTAAAMDRIGLWKIASGPLSGTTNFVDCFPSDFDCFRVVADRVNVATAAFIGFRMLVGSTPDTTSAYYSAIMGLDSNNANLNFGIASTISLFGRQVANDAGECAWSYDFANPNVSTAKTVYHGTFGSLYGGVGGASFTGGGVVDIGTAFNGLQILTFGGQVINGGRVTIYGYRK